MDEYYSIVYMYCIFFIHLSVEGHLNCFHVLAFVKSAAVNTGLQVSFWIRVFSGYTPRSGITMVDLLSEWANEWGLCMVIESGVWTMNTEGPAS